MDLQKIKALIDLLADSPLAKLEIIEGEERVKLVKAKRRGKRGVDNAPIRVAVDAPASERARIDIHHAADPAVQHIVTPRATQDASQLVRAPMFGIVHLAPSASEVPFVQVGDAVEEGKVLCTIEAMKMFNAIESDCRGTVQEVLVTPGSEVQLGQPLFRMG